jgi:hypothetical protein
MLVLACYGALGLTLATWAARRRLMK